MPWGAASIRKWITVINNVRTAVAVMLAAGALAAIVWTLATAAPSTSPPELPTLTAPAPNPYPIPPTPPGEYPGPDPYPPPGDPYPAPYPAYLPFVQDGESYP